jgi:UDP-glucose 4-epimerase
MKILVIGGAGYIGSHMCKLLSELDHQAIACDDLSTGHREALRWSPLIECALSDRVRLGEVLQEGRFDAVMHFAARSLVAESVAHPIRYYENNVADVIGLLKLMQRHGPDRIIFSSTAAVYGHPQSEWIEETHPLQPINPYGRSKLMVEQLLADCVEAYQIRAATLRYFNAAGADPSGLIGEAHEAESHLIPRLLHNAAGRRETVKIFGDDYPTRDGTCVRDYVHVNDLCRAHVLALHHLDREAGFHVFNLGNGSGYSVLEIVRAVSEVVGVRVHVGTGPRRPGDPAHLVACADKAQQMLGWVPQHAGIHEIIESAWRWHRAPAFGADA